MEKFGWKITEFVDAAGVSRSRVYELMQQGCLQSVKLGRRRLITTHPREFLTTLSPNDGRGAP
jgi:hypothetical protein